MREGFLLIAELVISVMVCLIYLPDLAIEKRNRFLCDWQLFWRVNDEYAPQPTRFNRQGIRRRSIWRKLRNRGHRITEN